LSYNRGLRRLISITILLLIGLSMCQDLFAFRGVRDADLPACCRKNGQHHCGMRGVERSGVPSSSPTLTQATERCPFDSKALVSAFHSHPAMSTAQAIYAEVVAHPSGSPQTSARLRININRSRQRRGPPSNIL
jgi:hypothetical protein